MYLFTALAGGIICSEYFIFPAWVLSVPFLLAFLCARKFKRTADWLLVLTIFLTGQQVSFIPHPESSQNTTYLLNSRCEEILPRHHYILSVGQQKFYLNNYYTDTLYRPGDSLTFCARIIPFSEHANPGEFSYAQYLRQKNVYCQVIPSSEITHAGYSHNLPSFFYHLREKVMHKTALLTQDSTCRMLINALCLGYKTDLDNEFRNLFITTGTVHLLSVSGLHTGALYLFFLFILKHIGLPHRKAGILLLPILWSYACLTGLAPSVVRASTILSFITVGKAFSRTYTPLNSIAASAFFTLLIQPSALYSLSFLLSYSAYTGILIFYPVLFRPGSTLPPVFSKIYACCCITIATQLPTLPLSAFYFHTINLNSFLANLIAVPLATLLLYSSACCLILPLFLSRYISGICELLCRFLVRFLQYFAPYSVNISDLYPTLPFLVLIYSGLLAIGCYVYFRKRYWLYLGLAIVTFLLFYLTFSNIHQASKNEIVILHYPRQSVILFNYQGYYLFLQNTLDRTTSPLPYIRQQKLKKMPSASGISGKDFFYWSNQLIYKQDTVTIASSGNTLHRPGNILIVNHNLTPQQVFHITGPQHCLPARIILDGSNNKYTITQWKLFCQDHNILLQNTAETGFIRITLK